MMAGAFVITTDALAGEIVVSGGTVTATDTMEAGREGTALSINYQGRLTSAARWSVGWMQEDFSQGFLKRRGVVTEVMLELLPSTNRFNVSLILGPYAYHTSGNYEKGDGYGIALQSGFDATYKLNKNLTFDAGFRNTMTTTTSNTDLILIGLGYRK